MTGFHRKHAIRVLKKAPGRKSPEPRQRARIYNEAVREALTIVWEAADRICGKRLRQVMVGLVDAMERHGHLKLDAAVRESLLSMSAATMDRLLTAVRDSAKQGRRRTMINTALRKSIPVRTFGDWHDPMPGGCDCKCHSGRTNFRRSPSEGRTACVSPVVGQGFSDWIGSRGLVSSGVYSERRKPRSGGGIRSFKLRDKPQSSIVRSTTRRGIGPLLCGRRDKVDLPWLVGFYSPGRYLSRKAFLRPVAARVATPHCARLDSSAAGSV